MAAEDRLRQAAAYAREHPMQWTNAPDVPGPSYVLLSPDEVDRLADLMAAARELCGAIAFEASTDLEEAQRRAEWQAPMASARSAARAALAALDGEADRG